MTNYLNTRREFLQKGMALVAIAPTVPTFLGQTAWAMTDPLDVKRVAGESGKDGKILVVVQLSGGNDGLNTIVPHGDDIYFQKRPNIAVEKSGILKIDDYLGMHPNLTGLKELLDQGKMAIVQGVGYPNPNRSHFRSMDIWHSAQPDRESPRSGWIGRYFDNTCNGADPYAGVSINDTLPLAMQGERITPLTFERPEAYRYNGKDRDRYETLVKPHSSAMQEAKAKPKDDLSPNGQLAFLQRIAMDAQLSSDKILKIVRGHAAPMAYPPGEFGNGLRTVAA